MKQLKDMYENVMKKFMKKKKSRFHNIKSVINKKYAAKRKEEINMMIGLYVSVKSLHQLQQCF